MVKRKNERNDKYSVAKAQWKLFIRKVPSDDAAADTIFKALEAKGRIVCCCGSSNLNRHEGSRFFICRLCKLRTYFTVGTAFEDVSRLQAWLGAIHFAENNIAISALGFSKIAKVAFATARNCLLRAAMIVAGSIDESAPVLIGGELLQIIFRRSSETPARLHPQAEQDEVEKELAEKYSANDSLESSDSSAAQEMSNFPISDALTNLSSLQKQVLEFIGDTPISIDDLCDMTGQPAGILGSTVVMLALDGLIQDMPGGRYIRTVQKEPGTILRGVSTPTSEIIGAAITFIRKYFQGVSRKCLQLYLAIFWYCVDQKTWKEGVLLSAFLDQPPLGRSALINYVSPHLLKMPIT